MGQRLLVRKTVLDKVAESSSEARPYDEIAKDVAMEVSVFPSEQLEKAGVATEAAKLKYQCDMCGLLLNGAFHTCLINFLIHTLNGFCIHTHFYSQCILFTV